jgi:hypothetical protein
MLDYDINIIYNYFLNIRYDMYLYKPDHAMEKCLCIQFWSGRHNDGPAIMDEIGQPNIARL